MVNEILNPNCSESVFKLSGGLEDIKKEVLKMLDIWQNEAKNDGYNQRKKEIKRLRERIRNIKKLEEFEFVVFDFTCNYETYFKEDKGNLLVATCNNHDWDDVNSSPLSNDDYYKIAKDNLYKLIFQEGNYVIAKKDFSEEKPIFLEVDKKIKFEYDKTFKLIKKRGSFYISNDNQLVKIREIKDKDLKNKLLVLANL